MSGTNKVDAMNYLKREGSDWELYNDKLRLLIINIICGSDIGEIR